MTDTTTDVCPLCEAAGARVVYETQAQMFWVVADPALTDRFAPVRLRQCDACGHVFNRELAPETISEIYRRQTATNRPVSADMHKRYDTLLEFLGSDRLVGKRILEVGGGTGSLARLLADLGADVTVVEPNDELQSLLGDQADRIRVINDFFGPGTLDETFDGVICRQVVEHIADVRPFVRALGAAVNQDGFAYIEVPTLEFIAKTGAYMEVHVQHLHYLDDATRRRLLADAGLVVTGTHDILQGHDVGILAQPGKPDVPARNPVPSRIESVVARRDAHQAFLAGFDGDRSRTAIYGATSQGVTFFNLFAPGAAPARFVDDNPDYAGRLAYGRGGAATIHPRSDELLTGLDHVFVGAYHHQAAITAKLADDGFKGTVWSTDPRRPTIERVR
ncbi:putative NDP-hexose methyltransferase protein [alpha proteobacterium BAL199]|jgi:2-polyprenyl-3-methyl-5-hydroxy-6-metoxy-1,4-benzoquinol methylase|nr:putative NDP-hexose methyltransferase protein [alpha proteobacterium BAL199]